MQLSLQPRPRGSVSGVCTDDAPVPGLGRSLPCAAAQRPMILISTIRHGAIAVGITAAVAVGVYLAVLLSLFDL